MRSRRFGVRALCVVGCLTACTSTPEAPRDAAAEDVAPDLDAPEVTPDASPAPDVVDGPDGMDAVDVEDVDDASDAEAGPDVTCAPEERACGGRCVDARWDGANCGACGEACGAGIACSLGRCQPTCDAPRSLCVVGGAARCVDALADPANCGECGRVCGDGQACMSGRCACPAGRMQCGARCADVQEDPGSCGGCGVVCPAVLNGRAVCVRGACGLACSEGFHRCGSACVDDRAITSCGALCVPCPPVTNGVPTCDGRACGATCAAGYHLCAGVCVLNASLATCGAACTPCPAPANAVATCDGRACGFACNAGFHVCDGACLSNLAVTSCGAACGACAVPAGAAATCDGRACGFACNAGLGNCDADLTNGCETDLRVTAAHCGACGRPCAAVAGARAACVAGACGFVCDAGVADCDRNPANGCETDIRWSVANCGACARACATGEVCAMGACRLPRTGWSKRFGDTSDDGGHAIAADGAGNSVIAGRLSGPTRIGAVTVAGAGTVDAFALGLGPDNAVRWARSFGGATADAAYGVALDGDGNAVVVGTFTGRADLGRGAVASLGDADVFVTSLAPDGTTRWVRTFGADGADAAYAVAVDATGVYVTGSVRGSVNFGGGVVAGTTSPDPFVLALGPDGAFRWARRFGAVLPRAGSGAGYGIAVGPDGGVVAVGYFQGAPTFGGDVLASAGNFDIFAVSLASTGAQRWARRVGGPSVDWAQAVTIDAMNQVYVTGYYQGVVDFGGGALTAPSGTDGFVASFSVAGAHRWSRRFGGAAGVFGTATGYDLALDASGNLVVSGSFSGNVDFGGGFRASGGGLDAFLASFTSAGAPRWSRRFGGDGDDELRGLAADSAGNVYAAGVFEGTVDYGVGPLVSAGAFDAVALQFVQ